MPFEPRIYRNTMNRERFSFFNIIKNETDLWIGISHNHYNDEVIKFCNFQVEYFRSVLEKYISRNPDFIKTLSPLKVKKNVPGIIKLMLSASVCASVGPMAAVAGAVCEMIGENIMKKYMPHELVIENGGDIYVLVKNEILVQCYAGENKNFMKLALSIPGNEGSLGICTSSGMFGHSLSFGKADSLTVVAKSPAIADAYATSLCNKIISKTNIPDVLDRIKQIPEILSVVAVKDDEIGILGKYPVKLMS